MFWSVKVGWTIAKTAYGGIYDASISVELEMLQ